MFKVLLLIGHQAQPKLSDSVEGGKTFTGQMLEEFSQYLPVVPIGRRGNLFEMQHTHYCANSQLCWLACVGAAEWLHLLPSHPHQFAPKRKEGGASSVFSQALAVFANYLRAQRQRNVFTPPILCLAKLGQGKIQSIIMSLVKLKQTPKNNSGYFPSPKCLFVIALL